MRGFRFPYRHMIWTFCVMPLVPVTVAADEVTEPGVVVSIASDDLVSSPVSAQPSSAACAGCRTTCGFCRAGHPESVRRHATWSESCKYVGYYVGGSRPVLGEGRCGQHEGTWGWDYWGLIFAKRVTLNWSHHARRHAGEATYKTDGPKLRHE